MTLTLRLASIARSSSHPLAAPSWHADPMKARTRARGVGPLRAPQAGKQCPPLARVAAPAARSRMVAFAVSQPDYVDINEILFRPKRQEL